MRSRKLALVVAPFLLLSILPGAVTAAQPKDDKAAHHAKVVHYWTPERIKNAKPRDFEFDPAKGGFKPAAKPAPRRPAAATSRVPRGPVPATSSREPAGCCSRSGDRTTSAPAPWFRS